MEVGVDKSLVVDDGDVAEEVVQNTGDVEGKRNAGRVIGSVIEEEEALEIDDDYMMAVVLLAGARVVLL